MTSSPGNLRPTVLWLADNPDWAYASIVRHVGVALPEYDHRVWYCAVRSFPNDGQLLSHILSEADVIVAMYLRYTELMSPEFRAKIVTMLTGFRPFEVGPC